jgi:hypothetical protein
MELYTEADGEWNITLELEADTPFVLLVSVKDNWEIDNVQVSGSKGGSGFMSYEIMTKLEDDNQFGISADNMYYYHFEGGLSGEAYVFTFKAVDEDGNTKIKRSSFVVG